MQSKIRHMWNAGTPNPNKKGAGFPILENATHTPIFQPDREAGAYNHHSRLTIRNGIFHAMWSNHTHGEDGPGQRVLYATSETGADWSEPVPLFPAPQEMIESEKKGIVLTAFKWVSLGDRLFAVVGCHENIGFSNFDQTEFSPVRDKQHPSRARKGYSLLACEVRDDGRQGPIFAVWEDRNEAIEYEVLPYNNPEIADQAKQLRDILTSPMGMPAWDFRGNLEFPKAYDGHRLCEPTVYRAKDGTVMMLLRDTHYSHRMYLSTLQDDGAWSPGVPTDIPDSPSLTDSLALDDGTVLLIGNQMAPKFDNPDKDHYNRDPLVVSVSPDGKIFERAYALRCGGHEYRVSQSHVKGRGGGAQYPSAAIGNGTLYVQYSMGKEDIWISSVPLADILAKPFD
ncbi:MAG: exo-alpha-sialidase [Verrucomicrobiota bacterium]